MQQAHKVATSAQVQKNYEETNHLNICYFPHSYTHTDIPATVSSKMAQTCESVWKQRDWSEVRVRQIQEVLEENLLQNADDLRGPWFIFQPNSDLKK